MGCTVQIRILKFVLLSKASLPYNRTLISLFWFSDRRDLLMFIESFMRISRILLKNWYRRKKCNVIWAWMLQEHNAFKVSSELYRNLCWRKWLNLNLNPISNFIPARSWMLISWKTVLSLGLITFSKALLKLFTAPLIGIKFVPLPL